jgi:hypothetical protein
MNKKHCKWCDHSFDTSVSYQIYCSASCRDSATREKIAERYQIARRNKRRGKPRLCKSCDSQLSIYNDDRLCQQCTVDPSEVTKALKAMKGIANGKDSKN